jgi:hypothetical protein
VFGFLKGLFGCKAGRAPIKRPARSALGKPPMTPQRAELIEAAMAVHRAKRPLLDDLPDEDRAKLLAMAITAFAAQGQGPEPSKKSDPAKKTAPHKKK